jgi:hypothetical protein
MENEKGSKRPGMESSYKIPKKAYSKKHCNLCKKNGGTHTTHNTQDCCEYEKNGIEKSIFQVTKKGTKNPIPQNSLLHNYARK